MSSNSEKLYYQRYSADRRTALCEQLHTLFSQNPIRAARVIAQTPGIVAKYGPTGMQD